MKTDPSVKSFRVPAGKKVDLRHWPTKIAPLYDSPAHCTERLEEQVKQLADQQRLLYASNQTAVLIIFQAMDAAGKDSAIKHVMSGVNPQGCQVFSCQHPSAMEQKHDFLWRTTRDLPESGRIGIFNRSYYEEVLIARVHPEIAHAEGMGHSDSTQKQFWHERYQSIATLERHLTRNATVIIKFYLHLSPKEQKKRFLERIDHADKNWKFSAADMHERTYWSDYMRAYEKCLAATSTRHAPWYVIPADDKPTTWLLVSQVILSTLKKLNMTYPQSGAARTAQLATWRRELTEA